MVNDWKGTWFLTGTTIRIVDAATELQRRDAGAMGMRARSRKEGKNSIVYLCRSTQRDDNFDLHFPSKTLGSW